MASCQVDVNQSNIGLIILIFVLFDNPHILFLEDPFLFRDKKIYRNQNLVES